MRHFIALIACASFLSGCSVAMAAKKSGHSVDQVQKSTTRHQMLALVEQTMSSSRNAEGKLVETYRIQKERGSALRALMHGVLDLSSFGLWEIVGTPMEATLMEKEFFVITVTYASDESRVEKVELN